MSQTATGTVHDPLCDCSRTRTGACFETGTFEYFCAVSEASCNPTTQNFVSADALADVGEVDCRLCSAGSVSGVRASVKNQNFSTGEIIGITIGSCFAFMILFWLMCCACRRGCCKGKKNGSVPKTVDTTGVEVDDTADDDEPSATKVSAHDAEMT
jgi:hypothetical protein